MDFTSVCMVSIININDGIKNPPMGIKIVYQSNFDTQ